MLGSLRIEGFRAFDKLEIPRLGRINLLVGRNSVGKSTVLEAVRLWAAGDAVREPLTEMMIERHEYTLTGGPFHVGVNLAWRDLLHSSSKQDPPTPRRITIAPAPSDGAELTIEIQHGLEPAERLGWDSLNCVTPSPARPCIALPARGWTIQQTDAVWQSVALSDEHDRVLEALRLIHDDIVGLAFLDVNKVEGNAERPYSWPATRIAVVKRQGRIKEPLKRLGDGIERLLQIILALVNARGGFLLLDEVENGIHYRVQPDLWRLIFKVATDLDVQVFAATHSWDCITAFQQAATDHPAEGMLIKLEKDAHGARAKLFDEADLAVVTAADIEVR